MSELADHKITDPTRSEREGVLDDAVEAASQTSEAIETAAEDAAERAADDVEAAATDAVEAVEAAEERVEEAVQDAAEAAAEATPGADPAVDVDAIVDRVMERIRPELERITAPVQDAVTDAPDVTGAVLEPAAEFSNDVVRPMHEHAYYRRRKIFGKLI